ncbi:MAG: hypothetical protein WCW36_01305 [Candidatus Paceibacterota bacterium]|jgi:hypothetical protein
MEKRIEEILRAMGPSLREGFEKKFEDLREGGIMACLREAETISREQKCIFRSQMVFAALGLMSCLDGAVFGVDISSKAGLTLLCLILFIIGMISVLERKVEKCSRTRGKKYISYVLASFQDAVDGLDPLGIGMCVYTPDSVRRMLMMLADRLERAEREFIGECVSLSRSTSAVINYGKYEQTCRAQFEGALMAAEKFGLNFDRRELFLAAHSS